MMFKIILLVLTISFFSKGQVLRMGNCPNVTAVPNFNIKKFSGIWYEQVHTRRELGVDLRCSIEHFWQTGPRSFNLNSFTFSPSANRSYHIQGNGTIKGNNSDSGLLDVFIYDMNLRGDVLILDTDYKSFAVFWSCINVEKSYLENIIIVTRDKYAKNSTVLNALNVLTRNKITKASLKYTDNFACPNYEGLFVELKNSLSSAPNVTGINVKI
ncbi:apolipoprotein D-like [Neocloeon triangulifer]|uniref:apolipoprotein D-like n=1 Tax=Neocloeon triangulifer TaxID=2078957 RepID=UPI00286FA8CA|nr:apolipoprotein D-like [Neocloeon triangulifer]